MTREAGVFRLGLLGPYASRNLGDTAIQQAVMANLKLRIADIEFVGICPDAEDTLTAHGIAAFPASAAPDEIGPAVQARLPVRMPFSAASWIPGARGGRVRETLQRTLALINQRKLLGSLDALLVSGSGQLDDFWGGSWGQPYRLLTWTRQARLRGLPVGVFGIGWDHLESPLSKRMLFSAMRAAQFRCFRDPATLQLLNEHGFREASSVAPDPAFGLPREVLDRVPSPPDTRPFAVVSPISHTAWSGEMDPAHEPYTMAIVAACTHLLQKGLDVRIVCSQRVMDKPLAERIAAMVIARGAAANRVTVMAPESVSAFVADVRDAQVVVASRLHAAILSLAAGAPVVAVSYSRKVSQMMSDAGLREWSNDLHGLNLAQLLALLDRALDQSSVLRTIIQGVNADARQRLDREYDSLVTVLTQRAA